MLPVDSRAHGSNSLGCFDGDKHEMNAMSECQVEAVRGVNDGATGVNEGGREQGEDRDGAVRDAYRERMSAGRHTAYSPCRIGEMIPYGESESETEWCAGEGRWSWLNPCPEYCTNCGREADTIAERSPVASINKIN